jgi:hypothetical protein
MVEGNISSGRWQFSAFSAPAGIQLSRQNFLISRLVGHLNYTTTALNYRVERLAIQGLQHIWYKNKKENCQVHAQ